MRSTRGDAEPDEKMPLQHHAPARTFLPRGRLVVASALAAAALVVSLAIVVNEASVGAIPSALRAVPGTEDASTALDRVRRLAGASPPLPEYLRAWRGFPFWKHQSNMPVYETENADAHEVIVVGHATSWAMASTWYASLVGKNVGVKITGLNTKYGGFADKLMGLRAAVSTAKGDHLFVFSDVRDVLFLCQGSELVNRFKAVPGMQFVSSSQPVNWPVVPGSGRFYGMKEANAFKDRQSRKICAAGVKNEFKNEKSDYKRKWSNSGVFAGRRKAIEQYLDYIEEDLKLGMHACKPYGMPTGHFTRSRGTKFDDQLCMNSYLEGRFDAEDAGVFLDEPGAIFLSTGNFASAHDFTFPEHPGEKHNDTADVARIWYKRTGVRPCALHFNGMSHNVMDDVLRIAPYLAPEEYRKGTV